MSWRQILAWEIVPEDPWIGHLVHIRGYWGVVVGTSGIDKSKLWSWYGNTRRGALDHYEKLKSNPATRGVFSRGNGGELAWLTPHTSLGPDDMEFIETPPFSVDLVGV